MGCTRISPATARRCALNAQLLDGRTKLARGKEGVAQAVEKLGYVQIDTISVVERAHHHTLWTRCSDYEKAMLDELMAKDRRVFEYWGHGASYLPISDYRYYLPRKRAFPWNQWERRGLEKHGTLMTQVLERIRHEGPLASKDFASQPGKKRGSWWDWKETKVALELLFWRGDLMIAERRNFQRVYDLTERVLPSGVDTRLPNNEELGRFFVRRALSSHGIGTEREIHEHIHAVSKEVTARALRDLLDAGELLRVDVAGDEGREYYGLPSRLEQAARLRKKKPRLHVLSPFDNLIIQRERTKRLFGFDYALECYVPAAKRTHGYFALPLLWGERFVGRLDAKADRKQKRLLVRNLFFEQGMREAEALLPDLVRKLMELARFAGCVNVDVERTSPRKARAVVRNLLLEHL